MSAPAVPSMIRDPMLLPPREAPYRLQAVYERTADECRQEIVFDWGDSYLAVLVDGDWDTLDTRFQGHPFTPTAAYRAASDWAPWDRLVGKACDWTWVAVNRQGYPDLIVLSFDVVVPQVLLHALASSIEVFTVSERDRTRAADGGGLP